MSYTMPETPQARAAEIEPTVLVRYQDGSIAPAIVLGQALKFPMIRLRDGGTVEVSRPTLIDAQRNGTPVGV